MHLTSEQRHELFRQIDHLVDAEDWDDGDVLISQISFDTFLRFIIYFGPVRRPSLTVANSSRVAASWFSEEERLTIEFGERDRVRGVIYQSNVVGNEPAVRSYLEPMLGLDSIYIAHGVDRWSVDFERPSYRDAAD
jgi:hypothetical protein